MFRRRKPQPPIEHHILTAGAVQDDSGAWFGELYYRDHTLWASTLPWPDEARAAEHAYDHGRGLLRRLLSAQGDLPGKLRLALEAQAAGLRAP